MKKAPIIIVFAAFSIRLTFFPLLVNGQSSSSESAAVITPTLVQSQSSSSSTSASVSPEPTAVLTPAPTETPAPSPSPTSVPIPTSTPLSQVPVATPSAIQEASPEPPPASPSSPPVSNSTLQALGIEIVPSDIATATSSSVLNISTVLNMNAVGGDPVIVNATDSASLDLSRSAGCRPFSPAGMLDFTNNAVIALNANASALTGANTLSGQGTVRTGDATAQVNVSTVANTNLIGSCWNFTVLNVSGSQTGNIILPYELQFLNLNATDLHPVSPLNIDVSNSATIGHTVAAEASTGSNTALHTQTGAAQTSIHITDLANTNIYANNWLLLQVHSPRGWSGTFENWWGNTLSTPQDAYAWIKLPDNNSSFVGSGPKINIQNSAQYHDNISAVADTGDNSAPSGNVDTGNAKSGINIFNIINTNIAGSNWYFAVVNLFDSFTGNIVFPRPDLALTGSSGGPVHPGDTAKETLTVRNMGTYPAPSATIRLSLPSGLACQKISEGGTCGGNVPVWNLGELGAGESRIVEIELKTSASAPAPSILSSTAVAATTGNEPNKDNNTVLLTESVESVSSPVQAASPDPSPSPFPLPAAGEFAPHQYVPETFTRKAVLAAYYAKPSAKGNMATTLAIQDPAAKRNRNLAEALAVLVLLQLAVWGRRKIKV